MTIPSEMDALVADAPTGITGVRLARLPVPRPGPGQVLVRMQAKILLLP